MPNNRLKKLREKSKLTQKEVAKLVDVTEAAVSRHESSSRGLTTEMVQKYASVYKVTSAELFVELPVPEEEDPEDLIPF